jgi:hypothetical protein
VLLAIFLGVHLVLWPLSGYRAWVQVYDVKLLATGVILRPGTSVTAFVTTSGRITIDTEIVLEQDSVRRTLARKSIPSNGEPMYDPRSRHDSLTATIDSAALAGLKPGTVTIRAIASGRAQFTRTPPPVVRVLSLELPAQR